MPEPRYITEGLSSDASWFRRVGDVLASLQVRSTTLVVFLCIAVVGASSSFLVQSSVAALGQQQDEAIVGLSALMAEAAGPLMATPIDTQALTQLAERTADGAPLVYVVIYNTNGQVLASAYQGAVAEHRYAIQSRKLNKSALGTPTSWRKKSERLSFREIVYPINTSLATNPAEEASHVLTGYVRTAIPPNTYRKTLASSIDMLIGVGIIALVFSIPLGFLLVRRIASPLHALATAMLDFSQGDLQVRSPEGRRDEIGQLARAFNRMADQHQQAHEGVLRLNAELEQRVLTRTEQLRDLASRDPLTGLYNRRHLGEALRQAFVEAQRYEHNLACIMIDLDDFKDVNDLQGHRVGDQVLVLAAETIKSQLRSSDIPARPGGDEFVILLPQTSAYRAATIARRIISAFCESVKAEIPEVSVGMSAGISDIETLKPAVPEILVDEADRALYQAKADGKHRVCTPDHLPDPLST